MKEEKKNKKGGTKTKKIRKTRKIV